MSYAKPASQLTPSDLEQHPVWIFDLVNEGMPGRDETWMVPVKELPVFSLSGCGCLANAVLACGKRVVAILWGIDLANVRVTEQFITISFWLDDNWWPLSDRAFPTKNGSIEYHRPADLAAKLGLDLTEIFPITYDISEFALGPAEITRGSIFVEPREKLSRQERLALALQRSK